MHEKQTTEHQRSLYHILLSIKRIKNMADLVFFLVALTIALCGQHQCHL